MRRGTRLLAALGMVLALGACTKESSPDDTEGVDVDVEVSAGQSDGTAAEPSHDSPDGAMAGLLVAMRAGGTEGVLEWVSPEPESDRASITQTSRMGAMLGLPGQLFWLVDERNVVEVTNATEDEADVRLDGYIVWCNGEGPDDPKASCAQPHGAGETQTTTYRAVRVGGQWYVHLDLNKGELIQGNPGRAGKPG